MRSSCLRQHIGVYHDFGHHGFPITEIYLRGLNVTQGLVVELVVKFNITTLFII